MEKQMMADIGKYVVKFWHSSDSGFDGRIVFHSDHYFTAVMAMRDITSDWHLSGYVRAERNRIECHAKGYAMAAYVERNID